MMSVSPKELSDAVKVRLEWMRMMGMGQDQIEHSLRTDKPISLEDERRQLEAMHKILGQIGGE